MNLHPYRDESQSTQKSTENMKRITLALVLLGLGASFSLAEEKAKERIPDGLSVQHVTVSPEAAELTTPFTYRQLLITGELASGETVDLTRLATLESEPKTVTVSPGRKISPQANGAETLVFRYGQHEVRVPVKVTGAEVGTEVSFVQDVMPALSKMGCNAGACHGAKDGKNGFKLSLRGYDIQFDHRAFADDVAARRINRSAPDQSLMLLKATGSIPHVGGAVTEYDSAYYRLIRRWIASGVPYDPESPRVASIEVHPINPVLPRANMRQQITVIATYTDGAKRDVTHEAFIESGDIEVATTDSAGVVTLLRRGEAPMLVRYEGAYAATTISVMGDRKGFRWQAQPVHNYIDELVDKKLQHTKTLASPLCRDEEFIRRVYLDLTGLPPTAAEVLAFLADERPTQQKRDELIDQLVGSGEYVEHWTNKWADLLQVNRKFLGEEGALALRNWIKDAVASNKPYDELAYEILTAKGSNMQNPAAAYWKINRAPDATMENTTHLFLAVRFSCNKCHDHPFERWTQDQYYTMAAYFARVGFKEDPQYAGKKLGGSAVEGARPLVEVVYDKPGGEMTHLRTGQTAAPKFPYQQDLVEGEGDRRELLARWVTSADNQYFATSFVNRQWGYLLGRGVIEPIDDIRAGNPPTNPELLTALTRDFVDSGFDIQHLHRTICNSRTYQLSVATNEWNEDDVLNYSHAIARRLPAEVLYDTIFRASGAPLRLPNVPAGFRAAQLPDAGVKVDFLDDLGRPPRETACECERSDSVLLGPVMKLINGPTVAQAISDPSNAIAQLVREEKNDATLIDQLFLRYLSRHATEAEIENCREFLTGSPAELNALVARKAELLKTLEERRAAWEKSLSQEVVWTPLTFAEMKSKVGATFKQNDDQTVLVTGALNKDTYQLAASTTLKRITGLRLEALPDDSLAARGPGRAQNGNFVLSEIKLTAAPAEDTAQATGVRLHKATADFNQDNWHVSGAVDGNPATGWAVSPKFGVPHTAVFETAAVFTSDGGAKLSLELLQDYPDGKHLLGKFRISVTDAPQPLRSEGSTPANILAIARKAADQRSEAERAALATHFRAGDTELAEIEKSIARLQSADQRLYGAQDIAWALVNNPAFLFNR